MVLNNLLKPWIYMKIVMHMPFNEIAIFFLQKIKKKSLKKLFSLRISSPEVPVLQQMPYYGF
jgi:hypothetical protein